MPSTIHVSFYLIFTTLRGRILILILQVSKVYKQGQQHNLWASAQNKNDELKVQIGKKKVFLSPTVSLLTSHGVFLFAI